MALLHRLRAAIRKQVRHIENEYQAEYAASLLSDLPQLNVFDDPETRAAKFGKLMSHLDHVVNCRPLGFYTVPRSRCCFDRFICPWCFVRERYSPLRDILEFVATHTKEYMFVCWTHSLEGIPQARWFSPRHSHGIHVKHKAVLTSQQIIYDLLPTSGQPGLRMATTQLLPINMVSGPKLKLPADVGYDWTRSQHQRVVNEHIEQLFTVDWESLLDPETAPYYVHYHHLCDGTKMSRISIQPALKTFVKDIQDARNSSAETEQDVDEE